MSSDDSNWSDYDNDDDLESLSGSRHANQLPSSPTSQSPRFDASSLLPEGQYNLCSLILDHPQWKKDESILQVGFLARRTRLSGIYELKFVEVRGGLLRYFSVPDKNVSISPKNALEKLKIDKIISGPATELNLTGASIDTLSSSTFTISFPYKYQSRRIRSRVFKIFSESEGQKFCSKIDDWITAVREASHWRYWVRNFRVPHSLKQRLCGVITVHIDSVELSSSDPPTTPKIDPYVVMRFGEVRARTITRFNIKSSFACSQPIIFDQYIQVPVVYDNPNWSLLIRVMDESLLVGDGLLGASALPLHAFGMNKEKAWTLPLVSESASRQTGKLICRTFYTSSNITRFLPLYPSHAHEPESIVAPHQVTMVTAKAHYSRIVALAHRFMTIREMIEDYIYFENFYVSFFGYVFLAFSLLVVPHHGLMIFFMVLGMIVLANHPEASTFWNNQSWWVKKIFFLSSSNQRRFKRSEAGMTSWSSSGLLPSEFSVYECERRKWSVSASGLTQYTPDCLKPSESRWVGILGDPISPESLIAVTDDNRRIIWNSVCNENTDNNGWEYGRNFPDKNWLEMTGAEERAQWSKTYDQLRHRVRRRLWVGELGGYINEGDQLPLSLPETIDAENEFVLNKAHRASANHHEESTKTKGGILAKYYRLMEILYRVQSGAASGASRVEQFMNIFSWKSHWLTGFFLWIILACLWASTVLSPNVLLFCIVTIVHYSGFKKWKSRMKRVKYFLKHFKEIVKLSSSTFRGGFGSDLLFLAKNPWAKFSTLEVSRDLINLAIQKTVDKLQLGIVVTLNDTKECACMFELVQLVYMKKFGPKKWASREIKSISLATLTDQHLLADWELYQPHSAFRHHNSIS